ncbi:hypothetical protein PAHAL_9G194800 [Panicum hallii]|uniref:Uncharacterized protein n=1 Tax=Panicum hallii TaxID=206008 RepID=A0A2T8I1S8_9POAL|nr:hypothetical protein PAHAL_9G194800 [Panicum hallii]
MMYYSLCAVAPKGDHEKVIEDLAELGFCSFFFQSSPTFPVDPFVRSVLRGVAPLLPSPSPRPVPTATVAVARRSPATQGLPLRPARAPSSIITCEALPRSHGSRAVNEAGGSMVRFRDVQKPSAQVPRDGHPPCCRCTGVNLFLRCTSPRKLRHCYTGVGRPDGRFKASFLLPNVIACGSSRR